MHFDHGGLPNDFPRQDEGRKICIDDSFIYFFNRFQVHSICAP